MKNTTFKKFIPLLLLTLFFGTGLMAQQNILISQGGTVSVSNNDNFYDAGGAAGNDGNTSYTITLAPSIAGEAVCVDFTNFISNGRLEIFDGPNTSSNNIGTLRGDYSLNYNASGTPYRTGQTGTSGVPDVLSPGIFCSNNASGVLTFRYTGPSGYAGWVGQVKTYKLAPSGCTVNLTATPSTICAGGSTTLNATGVLGVPLMSNDFNSGVVGTGWVSTASVSFQNILTCQPNNGFNTANTDGSIFVWMQSAAAPRTLETTSYDVSGGGYLSFDFREAADDNGGNGCEAPDDNEGIYVQYSTDGGATWNNMKLMFPGPESSAGASANIGCGMYVYDWNTTTVPLPAAALSANTKFRWTQRSSTTASQDSWGLDNVRITRYSTATLTITDLSTSTVIATTTTPSTSISVSPATTRTYRATLTDGTTTCTQDVTVTVNGGTPTVIGYPTNTSSFATTAPATNVTVISGPTPTAGSYTSSPAGLTMDSAGRITPSTSTPGTYTVTANTACGTTSATVVILPPSCGSCVTPTCIIGTGANYAAANTNHTSNCNTMSPILTGPSTYVSYHTVTVGTSGLLGIVSSNNNEGPASCSASRVFKLYPVGSCGNAGSVINPGTTNANGSLYSNPEWTGLTPGNYIVEITYTIAGGGCGISDNCQSYYSPNLPLAVCPVNTNFNGLDWTSPTFDYFPAFPTSFNCTDGPQTIYKSGETIVDQAGYIQAYPGYYMEVTTNANSPARTSLLISVNGTPYAYFGPIATFPGAPVLNFGPMSDNLNITQVMEPYLPAGANISIAICDTRAAVQSLPYRVYDYTTGALITSGTATPSSGGGCTTVNFTLASPTMTWTLDGLSTGITNNNNGSATFTPSNLTPGAHTIRYTYTNSSGCNLTANYNFTIVGSIATPTVSNASICSGQTTTLTAGNITSGATVRWYNAATGGSVVFTGNPFTTPALTANTSYWVTQSTTACGESTRVRVNVTVTPGTNPTYTTAKTDVTCALPNSGTITITPISAGSTYVWTDNGTLTGITTATRTGLAVGNYCVAITSPTVAGSTVTSTLFTENFESGIGNWTLTGTGSNVFVSNNTYAGASCPPFGSAPTTPNQSAVVTGNSNSRYLHIRATNSNPVSCPVGFPPLNANYNGSDGAANQLATLNTNISTVGYTNIQLSFYWLCVGRVQDYGQVEYSTNGGGSWTQAGSNLQAQSTWTTTSLTLPAAAENISNLRLRIRWINDASGSSDPPIAIDQIVITGQTSTIASCSATVTECFNIVSPGAPTITGLNTVCRGNTITLNGSGTPDVTTPWASSNTAVATITNVGVVTGVAPGAATITYRDNNGCTVTLAITVTASPTIAPKTATICSGNAFTVSPANTLPDVVPALTTYTWTAPTIAPLGAITGGSAQPVGQPNISQTLTNTTTAAATATYTVTATSGTCTSTFTTTVTVNPTNTITLTSAAATTTQTVCISNAITNITYTTTGATGATVTGLPAGVSGAWAGNVVTISGIPTASGTFNYTVTLTGGCGTITRTGTITVTANNTITLSSAVGTDTQTRCVNSAFTTITYATTGATGATVTGLPAGVTGNWASNVVTISGTPTATGTFNYTVTLSGGCSALTRTGTLTVNPILTPVINCGTATVNSIDFTWAAITGATSYTSSYTINGGAPTATTNIGNVTNRTISGLSSGDTVVITVTPVGGAGTCFAASTRSCTANTCVPPVLTLTSAATTNAQTVCVSTAITAIQYTLTPGTPAATGASITAGALPAGVTGTFAAGVFTISGTPTATGVFNYTVTTTGGCTNPSVSGTMTVTPNNTIALSSVAGTDAQTVCINNPIVNITYATTGATGATVTGLPTGVTGSWLGNVVTITGTPTVSAATPFTYTVTLSGGCGTVSTTGTITVNPANTITLTSAVGTNAQTLCINNAITTIAYSTTGATGATVTGLPTGVTGTWAGNVVTITGTPTVVGPFTYTITLTGGCGTITRTGTITVNPVNTITLTSAVGTNAQTLCINNAITTITYATTGATGATVTGLPTGVTGAWAGNVVTITGTPTVSGPFTYTVTLSGGCGTVSTTGTITVNPANTITLTSAVGTDAQTRCVNNAITNITYTTTGATGATFAGLPAGVTGVWAGNTITISGTPTTTVGSPFTYTITLTGGCGTITRTGTITVNPINTINLTSVAGTDAQTVCINTPITTITYATANATGATITGLPTGVTGAWAANVVTISGTPTVSAATAFTYNITLTGGCGTVSTTGTLTVTPDNTITLTSAVGTDSQTVCINNAINSITYSTTGATGATITGLPTGVTGSWAGNAISITGTPTSNAGSPFTYTITLTGGCGTITRTGTITVNPANTITLTSAATTTTQTVCINTPITTITYATTNATGATITGLPTGVTGAWAANVVTISGTPTVSAATAFTYNITLTGGCGGGTATGTITVNPAPTIVLTSGNTNQALCIGNPITPIVYTTANGATGASLTSAPAGVIGTYNAAARTYTLSGIPTASGTFNYTVATTGGCTPAASLTGTIRVNALPTLTVSSTACAADLLTYSITFASNGVVTSTAGTVSGNTVTNIPTGTAVTLTATLNTCTTTAAVSAPNCLCPPMTPPVSGGNQTICSTAAIPALTVTVGAGETADWYTSGGTLLLANSLSYTPVAAGSYQVEARNTTTNCLSTRTTITLTIDTAPTIDAGFDTTVCASTSTTLNSVTLSGATGTGYASLAWTTVPAGRGTFTNGNTLTPTFTPDPSITSGPITLLLTASSGNSCAAATDTMIVTVNPTPTLSIVSKVCAADLLTYTITFTSNGVVTASNGVVNNATQTITGIPSGTGITLTSTLSGCTRQLIEPIYSCACPVIAPPVSGGDQTICQGDVIPTLTMTVGANETVDWYTTATGGTILASGSTSYTPSAAGTFYAETRNTLSNCRSTTRTPIVLTINPIATVSAGSNQTICQGNSATLAGTFGGSATSGTWSIVSGGTGTFSSTTTPNAVFTPSAATTGTIVLRFTTNDPTGPCPAVSSTVDIIINPSLTANAGADQTICENGTATLAGTTNGSVTSGTWSIVSGGTGTFSNANSLTPIFTPVSSGATNQVITLRLTIAATATCPAVFDDVVITVNKLPIVDAGIAAETCVNGTITLNGSVTVNGLPTTGTWSAPSGTFSNTSALNSTYTPSITSGTVTLTLTSVDPTGPCGVSTDTVVITVNPTPTLIITDPAPVCAPATVDITAAAVTVGSTTGTLTYWENAAATIPLGTTAGVGTPSAIATSGTYYIRNTSAKGCAIVAPVNVVVNTAPTINLICGPATTSSVNFDWTNVPGATSYDYSYSVNAGPIVTGNIVAPSNFTVSGLNDGDTVSLTLTTVGLPCNGTATITCNATPCPNPRIDKPADVVSCAGSIVNQINFTSSDLYDTMRWTNSNTAIGLPASGNGTSLPAFTSPNVASQQVAIITIIGTHLGCDGPATNFTITVNPEPSLVITNPAAVCAGTTVDLTAAAITNGSTNLGTMSYHTDASGTITLNQPNTVATSGTYYIKTTAVGGCFDIQPVIVTVNPLPTVINTVGASNCGAGSVTLQATANPTGTIEWYDAAINGNLVGTGASWTTPVISATTTYYAQAVNASCNSAVRVPVIATINSRVTPFVQITASATSVCQGATITFTAINQANQGPNPTYQWYVDNVLVPGETNTTFSTNTLNNTQVVNLIMTSSLTCVTQPTFTTPGIQITVDPVTTPSVTISAAPNAPVCANESVTFTAVPNNLGTATPSYRWFKNGQPIASATGNTYTAASWTNNDRISCELTSSSACATTRVVMSNDIILSVRPNLAAAVTVIQNPSGAFCSGTAVTFTATPINGGATPSYAWYVNGGTNAVATGDTFTSSALLNNDVITVRMLSTENCTSNNPATSTPIRVSVIPSVAPSVSIVVSANPICSGTAVTFTATPTNGGTLPQYQWYLNGTPIAGEVTNRFITTALVDNDQIWVEITNTNVCGGKSLSNVITMTVNPLPDATLTGGTTICKDATAPILTFTGSNGIAPYTFTYTVGNNPPQTITTTGGNTAQIQVPTSTTGVYVYRLISVTASSTPACSKTITGQQQTVIVDGVPATVTIVTNTTTICPGSEVTFVANTTNAGTNPTYQWLLNTSTVVGTGPTFTSSTLRNNDVLNVIMTSSSACATNNPVTSPGVQIRVTPSVTPLVNIVADKNNICEGTSVRFTATPTNGGTNPIYIWKKNAVAVQSGASATFTTTSLGNNDVITVEMTSNQACVINNPAVSNAISMVVNPTLATSISISASETVICTGRTVDFIANGVNVGSAPTYQWFIGTRLVGTNSANFSSNTLQNGDVVRCTVINAENCVTGSPATSNLITMTVNPVINPTVTIIADKTAICKGSCVLFTARPVNGGAAVQYQWFLNDTPIAFANSITYTSCALVNNDRIYVEITNPTICAGSSKSNVITVSVTDLPTATITTNSTGTCIDGVQPEVTLTGFGGIAPYTFNYTVNGNLRTIRTTSTSDSVVIKVATTTAATFNYSLVSVTSGNTLACTQAQSGTASVTVEAVPFAPNVTFTQPTCTVGGTITVTAPTGAGYFYSIDGVDYTNTSGTFTNLGGGLYQVTYQNANGCISLPRAVRINDNGKPVPTPQDGAICFDASGAVINPYVLDSNLSPLNYDFVWTFNGANVGTQSTYTATAIGTYTVVATSKITGCVSDPITATVAAAQSPTVTATISAAFTDNASITVNTTPAGNYQYQLDQGPFQSSNVFTNVSAGEHTVTVITDACQPVIVNVSLINYPNYFTPNGDGIHDTWNVIGLKNQPSAKIHIFDRYGKLIKQISPVGDGWDGTFNSENLPSTDYWFTVDYIDTNTGSNKVFRSHFSLKR